MKHTCDLFRRVHRRDFLRVGGLGLCGVTMLDVLRAGAAAPRVPERRHARAVAPPLGRRQHCVDCGERRNFMDSGKALPVVARFRTGTAARLRRTSRHP